VVNVQISRTVSETLAAVATGAPAIGTVVDSTAPAASAGKVSSTMPTNGKPASS